MAQELLFVIPGTSQLHDHKPIPTRLSSSFILPAVPRLERTLSMLADGGYIDSHLIVWRHVNGGRWVWVASHQISRVTLHVLCQKNLVAWSPAMDAAVLTGRVK